MKITPGTVEGDHVILTGPIQGSVELADGTVIDVSAPFIEVDDDQAAEVADLIGQRYAEEGHPDLVENDPETGEPVQQQFVYVPPSETTQES
jgi:hypothetical protein